MFAAARATFRLTILVLLATICLTLIGSTVIAVITVGNVAVAAATGTPNHTERNPR